MVLGLIRHARYAEGLSTFACVPSFSPYSCWYWCLVGFIMLEHRASTWWAPKWPASWIESVNQPEVSQIIFSLSRPRVRSLDSCLPFIVVVDAPSAGERSQIHFHLGFLLFTLSFARRFHPWKILAERTREHLIISVAIVLLFYGERTGQFSFEVLRI